MSYNGQLGQSQLMVFDIMPIITVFYNNIFFCNYLRWQFLDMVPNTLSYSLDCSISPINSGDFHSFLYSYFHVGLLYPLRGPLPL